MDMQQQSRPHLEPIQEESEQEDEIKGSKTGEGEEEEEEEEEGGDFQIQLGEETKEVMTEEESEEGEDDAALLWVMRPRRLSRSLSQESFPQMQSTNNHQEETEDSSVSDWSSHAVDLSDEATPPGQARLGNVKRSISGELRMKISKIRWQKHTPPKPQVQKKTSRIRHKESSLEETFPKWLVDLMVNIEEATTHQLVVE